MLPPLLCLIFLFGLLLCFPLSIFLLPVLVLKERLYLQEQDAGKGLYGPQFSGTGFGFGKQSLEMSRNVQSGNTQNLKSTVIQRSFPKWSVAERRKTAAASNQAAVCACAHSRYFAGGSPSGLRV